jgi:hypothetical protein
MEESLASDSVMLRASSEAPKFARPVFEKLGRAFQLILIFASQERVSASGRGEEERDDC